MSVKKGVHACKAYNEVDYEENENAIKRAAQDVYALAADHDGPSGGYGYLDVYDRQKSRSDHDDIYFDLFCHCRFPVLL